MPLKTLFLVTLMVAFGFFTSQLLDGRPEHRAGINPRLQVSIFLLLQFGWLATNLMTHATLRRTWKTPPGVVRRVLLVTTWLSCFVQFLLVCLVTPLVDKF